MVMVAIKERLGTEDGEVAKGWVGGLGFGFWKREISSVLSRLVLPQANSDSVPSVSWNPAHLKPFLPLTTLRVQAHVKNQSLKASSGQGYVNSSI